MSTIKQNKAGLRVLIAGSILLLFLGILYVWSVFVKPVSEAYEWDIESVKLMTTFMLSFFAVGILAGGKMLLKIGASAVVFIGGMMLAAGMFVSAFLTPNTAWLMYLTYGIAGGFGVGAAYNAVISAAQQWFPKKRGFAIGVSVCAFGFAAVIFAPLIEALTARFGVRSTFMILAAIFFTVVLALFRFIRLPGAETQGGAAAAAADLFAKRQYTVGEALKTKQFYLITISMMFATTAFFVLNPIFVVLALERGLSGSMPTIAVMLTGVANASGRLCVPLLSDKIGGEKAVITIILATGVCALLLCFAQGFLFVASIVVVAFCFGGIPSTYPVITADYFGIKNVGSNYGAVMIGYALSALTFPMALALVGDTTARFVILAFLSLLGAALVVWLMRCKKR
ncbi:MAG: MFS transporter [Chitinispirillales bacterium]|jgi:OFA family oxalate/formate antiporter-like MFS transporter|nr:MFS transporter [Chitinispirillales bacterium]